MGQRHQAFIVARVIPRPGKAARYRCIGALHHQWCYGSLPLRATLRFCTLIKQPENSEIIYEELRALDGGGEQPDQEHYDIPCPFTQFLFLSAWGVSLDNPVEPYSSSGCSLSAEMGATDGDNNDGITVIDITHPEKPTYCFVPRIDDDDLVPKTAEEYALVYYPDDHDHLNTLIQSFDAIPLMSQDVIYEAWSMRKKSSRPKLQPKPIRRGTPSLVELTLKPAIEQTISENNTDLLDNILLDSNRVAIAKEIIRSHSSVKDGAIPLLQKLVSFQKDKNVDLSGFHLSGKQIVELLSLLEDSEITSLKLSHNATLKIDDLEQILQTTPKTLRRLILLDTGITNAEMIALLGTKPKLFYHLESIIHPAFLSGLYDEGRADFKPAFTHKMIPEVDYKSPWGVSLPFFTPNTLAQGLTDYLTPIREVKSVYSYSLNSEMAAMAAYAISSRNSKTWGERGVAFIPHMDWKIHLHPGEWLFFTVEVNRPGPKEGHKCSYAFLRANKEGNGFLSDDNDTGTRKMDILSRPDLFDVFDIRGFFKELELEGRPSPSPEVLEKLFRVVEEGRETFSFIGPEGIVEVVEKKKPKPKPQ